jgi:phage terminase small subunit
MPSIIYLFPLFLGFAEMKPQKPPVKLVNEALKFWNRHVIRLKQAGILTDRSTDSFLLLCQTWGMLQSLMDVQPGADNYREMTQVNALHKNYQALARQFGLLPAAAKQAKMDETPKKAKANEFGF